MSELGGAGLRWRRSSRCDSGQCVEVARLAGGGVAVRDSARLDAGMLTFTKAEWTGFLAALRGAAR
jgi:hypothetical protein